jgi:hypothetical protein
MASEGIRKAPPGYNIMIFIGIIRSSDNYTYLKHRDILKSDRRVVPGGVGSIKPICHPADKTPIFITTSSTKDKSNL